MQIVAAIRTPFCRTGTTLSGFDAVDLGRIVSQALLARTGIDPGSLDEVIFGCAGQPANATNVARVIALRAGVPEHVPAMTVQRNCASGLEAITTAADRMAAGRGELYLVGGVESMSNMPLLFPRSAAGKFAALARAKGTWQKFRAVSGFRLRDFQPEIGLKLGLTDPVSAMNMGETAELLAREFEITRGMQDAFALNSQQKAAAARMKLAEEITPIYVTGSKAAAIETDNGIRPDSSLESLAKLKPVFDPKFGTVTAGNSSQISDGAVALLVASDARAAKLGIEPLGRLRAHACAGCDPKRMGLGPVHAMARLKRETGLSPDTADLVEINEAFAAQVLAVLIAMKSADYCRRCGLDAALGDISPERLNPNGGAIALGHPVGASGARLVLTALMELARRNEKQALVSLCVGGGQGIAAWLER